MKGLAGFCDPKIQVEGALAAAKKQIATLEANLKDAKGKLQVGTFYYSVAPVNNML